MQNPDTNPFLQPNNNTSIQQQVPPPYPVPLGYANPGAFPPQVPVYYQVAPGQQITQPIANTQQGSVQVPSLYPVVSYPTPTPPPPGMVVQPYAPMVGVPVQPGYPVQPIPMQPGLPPGAVIVQQVPMTFAPPTPVDPLVSQKIENYIFLGTYGKMRAYELEQKHYSFDCPPLRQVWNEELKGVGYHMVHVQLHGAVLYGMTNGHVFCMDALTGKLIWTEKPCGQHGVFKSDICCLLISSDGNILYSAANGTLVAMNARTGQMIWHQDVMREQFTGQFGSFTLVEFKGMLFLGNDGHVYAFHMLTGQLIWKNSLSGYGYFPVTLAAYTFCGHGSYASDIVFVGTGGYVLALDAATGFTRSHINLDGTGYKPVAFLIDAHNDLLYTATSGELRCFKGESLKQLWKSDLPGLGYSFGHSLKFYGDYILIGMTGRLACLSRADGKLMWKTSLPGCGYDFVTLNEIRSHPHLMLCACNGKLYGVNLTDGKVEWKDGLKGLGYAQLTSSTTIADTDFNTSTLPQFIEMIRRSNK